MEKSTGEIRDMTRHIKKIFNVEKAKLEQKITMDELSKCLKNTRNNVALDMVSSQVHSTRSSGVS